MTAMPDRAILLMDLQHDFLGEKEARMPVDPSAVPAVLTAANAILARERLAPALPILVVHEYPAADHAGNKLRRGAAVEGSPGAQLDARLRQTEGVKVIKKSAASAFTNPELDAFLKANAVREIYILGVFAEACVLATVREARRQGYAVQVLAGAVATDSWWKKKLALWAMKRAGAVVRYGLPA